ncbi:hypothetical protein H0O02_03745 [Candidatus Micrarchaeota archaeon]|nr:hypothetical protein [Candidatus Micrarchaeota archaeon]
MLNNRAGVRDALLKSGYVVVLTADYVKTPEHLVTTMERVHRNGLVAEATIRYPRELIKEAMQGLRSIRQSEYDEGRRFVLGLGSITKRAERDFAEEERFDMLVGPGNMVSGGEEPAIVLGKLQGEDFFVAPGVRTPTELGYMLDNIWGFQPGAIKIFDSSDLGPKGSKSLLAPFGNREEYRGIIVMNTGGVNSETFPGFVESANSNGYLCIPGMSDPLKNVAKTGKLGDAGVIDESLEMFRVGLDSSMKKYFGDNLGKAMEKYEELKKAARSRRIV